MTVTAPKGFVAAGVRAAIKKSGNRDLALVQNLGPLNSAASVFTTNRCLANPVLWSKEVMADLTYALKGTITGGTGAAALALGRPAAGKTGTSQSNGSLLEILSEISTTVSKQPSQSHRKQVF